MLLDVGYGQHRPATAYLDTAFVARRASVKVSDCDALVVPLHLEGGGPLVDVPTSASGYRGMVIPHL